MTANVYTSMANAIVYTDRVSINTGTTSVTYQVYEEFPSNIGTRYTAAMIAPANSKTGVIVGCNNRMTVTGSDFTVTELGTTSSGIYSVGR